LVFPGKALDVTEIELASKGEKENVSVPQSSVWNVNASFFGWRGHRELL
jgi:hypothetical protein